MGFVATRGGNRYLVFRGTHNVREWIYDANIGLVDYPYLPNGGKVHEGFLHIYERCRSDTFAQLEPEFGHDANFYITGHSLGAALSLLALPDALATGRVKQVILYNFGCPRVGDRTFAAAYNALPGQQSFRLVNTEDLVTLIPLPVHVPVPIFGGGYFTHVDVPVHFTDQTDSLEGNHAMATYHKALLALQPTLAMKFLHFGRSP